MCLYFSVGFSTCHLSIFKCFQSPVCLLTVFLYLHPLTLNLLSFPDSSRLSHTSSPPHIQAACCQGQHIYRTDPCCQKDALYWVVLEERTTPTMPSEDHVLCQHALSDQCQLPGSSRNPPNTAPEQCKYMDTLWDSAHSSSLPTVLKKQRGDGHFSC